MEIGSAQQPLSQPSADSSGLPLSLPGPRCGPPRQAAAQPLRSLLPPLAALPCGPLTQGSLFCAARRRVHIASARQRIRCAARATDSRPYGSEAHFFTIHSSLFTQPPRPHAPLCASFRRGRCLHRPEPAAGGSIPRGRGGNRRYTDARCALSTAVGSIQHNRESRVRHGRPSRPPLRRPKGALLPSSLLLIPSIAAPTAATEARRESGGCGHPPLRGLCGCRERVWASQQTGLPQNAVPFVFPIRLRLPTGVQSPSGS